MSLLRRWAVCATLAALVALPSQATTVDYTADGVVSVPDVQCAILTSLWLLSGGAGAAPVCLVPPVAAVDANSDGAVNVSDILLTISAVFAGADIGGGVSIYAVQSGAFQPGTTVNVRDVVVTGVASGGFGLFVAEPEGGARSGVWVYVQSGAHAYAMGDVVHVIAPVIEYDSFGSWAESVTELEVVAPGGAQGSVEFVASSTISAPPVVSVATLSNSATAEAWEGCLVRAENLVVAAADLGFGEWSVQGGLVVDDKLYSAGPVEAGATIGALVGVLDYSFGAWKLLPRSSADIYNYQAPSTGGDHQSGELIITEIMMDPGIGCAGGDADNEYIELYNPTSSPVSAAGFVLRWHNSTMTIPAGVVIWPGEYLVAARELEPPCYPFTADITLSLALTNSGRAFTIESPTGVLVDAVDFTNWPSIVSGVALGVDLSEYSATGNDDPAHWCGQQSAVGIDSGTPGAANDACGIVLLPPGDCFNTSQCLPGESCVGIPSDGSPLVGRCVDTASIPGEHESCSAHADCGAGLFCGGVTQWASGFCLADWQQGTYVSTFWMSIPKGTAGASSSVVVYGQASVPLDVVVSFSLSHGAAAGLQLVLEDPNGQQVTLWDVGDGSPGAHQITVTAISSDDQVNGTWTLTVIDPTGTHAGVLQGWELYVTSNWD